MDGLSGHAGATTKICLNVNPLSWVLFISQVLYLTKVISIIQQHGLMGTSCFLQGIKPMTFGKIWDLTFWSQELKGTWLTFPCSTKEKNLSTSLLKAVIFISPCWSEDSMKWYIPTWKHIQYIHWQTSTLALNSNTHTFIYYLKGEELSFSFGVTPVANTGLVHDSGSDGPSRREGTCGNNFAP